MNVEVVLALTLLGGVGALGGGFILLLGKRISQNLVHVLVSFAAGSLLGVTFLELLPEAFEHGQKVSKGGTEVNIFLYAVLFVFLPNYKLYSYSIGNYGLGTTVKLFINGLLGLSNSLSMPDLIIFVTTAVFVGLNFALLLKTIDRLKNQKLRLSVGGGTILALVATGCSACGLSIISLFGLSAATFAFLPFKGVEFNLLALAVLIFTFFYTLQRFDYVCRVKN